MDLKLLKMLCKDSKRHHVMFHELHLVSALLCIALNVRFEIPYKVFSDGSRIFERGVADLTERYQNIQRQKYLSVSSVPFHNFKLKRPQRGGWLATQSTPPGSAPGLIF